MIRKILSCWKYISIFVFALLLGIGFTMRKGSGDQIKLECKPWFSIPKDVEEKLLKNYVRIYTNKFVASGCKIKPGYYFTVKHVLGDGDSNKIDIAVDDQKATIVSDLNQDKDKDIMVLSTICRNRQK